MYNSLNNYAGELKILWKEFLLLSSHYPISHIKLSICPAKKMTRRSHEKAVFCYCFRLARVFYSRIVPIKDFHVLTTIWNRFMIKKIQLGSYGWQPRHDDVIKWKHFPHYSSFVRGTHRSTVDSPNKGQWRGALMFSFVCAWTNGWASNWQRR